MAERTTPGTQVALTIAGSDPSGGAGIQADLKTFSVLNVFGCAVITALTAQNTAAVKRVEPVAPDMIEDQIAAVATDVEVDAVKTGMLPNADAVRAVATAISKYKIRPLVVDPVMVSTSGDTLADDTAVDAIRAQLLPLAAVTTPNPDEAARLLGLSAPPNDVPSASAAAKQICERFGAKACIVTGIRKTTDDTDEAVDVFYNPETHNTQEIATEWRPTTNLHGTGCTFSAAIAASLANGEPLDQAVQTAKAVVAEAIRQATDLGSGNGPINHLAYLQIKKK